ncbi:AAA family ATPase [Paraburkholderia madseniana]|uniref:AAA family ATPase n=1 Tax=Paraburkholderia madseniana TaxID=2599607 RepID=A0A6N6WKA6_9BURK|nr:AAA family ATPase [Paraburkholderia madseniana]KAE8761127.1 AAA family ATPase [Paraburkholderia madseniana]
MAALLLQQKPEALPVNFDGIPSSLKESPHWVLWQWHYDSESERWTKPPRQSDGQFARTNDPDTWTTFDKVHRAYLDGSFDGVGIVLRDDLVGIDLDHVLDESGEVTPLAAEIVERFGDAYMEKSPSGDGLHILTLGTFPRSGKGTEHKNIECYREGSSRYFTVTGHELSNAAGIVHQAEALDWLYETHFRKSTAAAAKLPTVTDGGVTKLVDDAVILANAAQAGNGQRFRKLFDYGDFSDYPSQSEADLALANMLAGATQDGETLDRLFRVSELFRPEKWDKSHTADGLTYGQMTIAKALTGKNATKQIEAAVRTGGFVRAADAMAETHTVEWLIDGVMEQGTSCMLFGASGSGKSFVAIDWSCCIVTGTDWHGQDVEPGAVFYIVGEGQKGFGRRLTAWQTKNNVSLQTAPLYLWQAPIPLSSDESVKWLAAEIAKVASPNNPPRMIVIDTLARNIGNADENSNRDMGLLMNLLDTHLRLPFNASVVIVHHSGNGDRDRLRGASGLTGAVDYEYRVDRKGDARALVCKKNKEGEEGEDRQFRIERVPLDGNISSAALVMLDTPSKNAAGVKLRAPSITCLSVLKRMTDACGLVPSDELKKAVGIGAPGLVVPKEKWKDESISAGISAGTTDDANRRAFDRAFDQLVNEANLVGSHGDYVWAK